MKLNYWEPKEEFNAEKAVMDMANLEQDWEQDNYIDTLHPEYAAFNPAAKAKTAVEAIERFNCNRYTATGWDVFRERLKAVCQCLDINPYKQFDLSKTGEHDVDIYAMKLAICRAMFDKIQKDRPARPFPYDQQVYRMVVSNNSLYVYHRNRRYFYYIEMKNDYVFDCPDEYESSWKALTASVEKLLVLTKRLYLSA